MFLWRTLICPHTHYKASARNAGDLGSIPELGRCPGEGRSDPLQYSCLENPMDGGAWWVTVHGVAKSQTQLSDFTFTFCLVTTGTQCRWQHQWHWLPSSGVSSDRDDGRSTMSVSSCRPLFLPLFYTCP